MNRLGMVLLCATAGVVLLVTGLLVPAHLRAVETSVLERAGRKSRALVDFGLQLVSEKKLGPARQVLSAAQLEALPGRETLASAITSLARQAPQTLVWGSDEPRLATLFGAEAEEFKGRPLIELIMPPKNRARALGFLGSSSSPFSQALLALRSLTNTVLFPPSSSSSGQALDASISICGLLSEEHHLSTSLSNSLYRLAQTAPANPTLMEQALLDFMSLGQRFNWGELSAFVEKIDDPETLRLLAHHVRQAERKLPLLYAAVVFTARPAQVSHYLVSFSQTGLTELGASLRFGAGGCEELLQRNQRLYSSMIPRFAHELSWRSPGAALGLKMLLYLAGGFFLAMSGHFARPKVSQLEAPLQVRGFHFAREILFALGFLLVVLLLSEPFLAMESQKAEYPFRLRLLTVGSPIPALTAQKNLSLMNQLTLLTMLLFFVLQALLYTACVVKLAEIRRQKVPPRIKLRLLENEDHLFDAGLYLGFVGTIISLILVSVGVIKQPSLMAAYSSTSFGIIFVSVFKIFNLRPVRRRLLLEAEVTASPVVTPGAATLVTPP